MRQRDTNNTMQNNGEESKRDELSQRAQTKAKQLKKKKHAPRRNQVQQRKEGRRCWRADLGL